MEQPRRGRAPQRELCRAPDLPHAGRERGRLARQPFCLYGFRSQRDGGGERHADAVVHRRMVHRPRDGARVVSRDARPRRPHVPPLAPHAAQAQPVPYGASRPGALVDRRSGAPRAAGHTAVGSCAGRCVVTAGRVGASAADECAACAERRTERGQCTARHGTSAARPGANRGDAAPFVAHIDHAQRRARSAARAFERVNAGDGRAAACAVECVDTGAYIARIGYA